MGIWSKTLILNGTEIKVCDMTKGNGSTFKTCGVDSIPNMTLKEAEDRACRAFKAITDGGVSVGQVG